MYHDYSVLVVTDADFRYDADDIEACLERMTKFLNKRADGQTLRMVTVEGKHGFPGLHEQPTDHRNKTAFIKSIDDYLTQLNEIIIMANFEGDPFIEALINRAAEATKTLTVYGYGKKA